MAAIERLLDLQAALEHVSHRALLIVAVHLGIMQSGSVVHFFGSQVQRDLAAADVGHRNLEQSLALVVPVRETHELDVHVLQLCRYCSLQVTCKLDGVISGHPSGDLDDRHAVGRCLVSPCGLRCLSISATATAYTTSTCNILCDTDICHLSPYQLFTM